ncbi:MAG: hypothetical protein QNJ14_04325 [Woeseiaceae bacterium]|nr:hypothetical protein [Woeseiaceae bacterium]
MKKFGLCLVLLFYGASVLADDDRSWAETLGAEISAPFDTPEHRAFDFWIGEWEMVWRPPVEGQLKHSPEGSWTRQRVFPILGGKALVELAWARDNPEQPSQRGFSIRYYDPERERWIMAQNWPNATNNGSAFVDQLIGDKHHGRLTMYSAVRRPNPDGEPTTEHRRYNFSDIRAGTGFRWDGSNTADLGATWYTWYVVDAYRKRDLDAFRPAGSAFPNVHEQSLCASEPHGAYDGLQGRWHGTATVSDGKTVGASFDAGLVLDGCGIAGVLSTDGARTFLAMGYFERATSWVTYRLSDVPGAPHAYFVSRDAGSGATFTEAQGLTIKDEFALFAIPENFSTEGALRRTVWTEISKDRIVLRDDSRADAASPWETIRVYDLARRE